MDKNCIIKEVDAPTNLYERIVLKISLLEARKRKIRLIFSSVFFVFSLFSIAYGIFFTVGQFSETGFYQYLSLLLSDGDLILVYWKEFLLAFSQLIPISGVTILFIGVLILMSSLKATIKNYYKLPMFALR